METNNDARVRAALDLLRQEQALQFNLLAAIWQADPQSAATDVLPAALRFGKYGSLRPHSYPFYRPCSKLFSWPLPESDERHDL